MKKTICLLLAFIMLAGIFAGCKKAGGTTADTTVPASTTDQTATTTTAKSNNNNNENPNQDLPATYNRDPKDLGEYELDVLHVPKDLWNMNNDLAPTAYTGDVISNAIFSRNEKIERDYNCFIIEHNNVEFYQMSNTISTQVLSGNCEYDAAYSEGTSINQLISATQVENLYSLSGLQLDESWWSQIVNEEATLGTGKYQTLYFTQSNLSLTAFDLTWCIYFNKKLYEDNLIEQNFYDLVRDGEWTVTQLYEIAQGIANQLDDESYAYAPEGHAIYGMTTYWNGAKAMMTGCNTELVTRNEDDDIVVSDFGERYVGICEALGKLFGESGTFTYGRPSTDGSTKGGASDYLKIFNANRALFLGAEVKSSIGDLKDFEYDYGILPMPTYAEGEAYRSWVNYLAPVLVIPKQTENAEKAAILLDALSYYSDKEVLPVYYNKVLRDRGAKDPDSIEMLEIINHSRTFEASVAYGWTREFVEKTCNLLFAGNGTAASNQPSEYREMIQTNIDNTLDDIFKD